MAILFYLPKKLPTSRSGSTLFSSRRLVVVRSLFSYTPYTVNSITRSTIAFQYKKFTQGIKDALTNKVKNFGPCVFTLRAYVPLNITRLT